MYNVNKNLTYETFFAQLSYETVKLKKLVSPFIEKQLTDDDDDEEVFFFFIDEKITACDRLWLQFGNTCQTFVNKLFFL